jgi:hypothetical protein
MTHKLDDIKLFCSECGGVDDNREFTFKEGSLLEFYIVRTPQKDK